MIGPIEVNVGPLQRGKMLPDLLWYRHALSGQSRLNPLKCAWLFCSSECHWTREGLKSSGALIHIGIDFDLDQPIRINKACDLHHRRDRLNMLEKASMHLSNTFPIFDMGQQDTRPHHIRKMGTKSLQCRLNNLKATLCLRRS